MRHSDNSDSDPSDSGEEELYRPTAKVAVVRRSQYESDWEKEKRRRKPLASKAARKSASWEPARYHYPLDSEDDTQSRKRDLPSEDEEADIDLRPAKRIHTSPSTTNIVVEAPEKRIKALQAQVDELHTFIQDAGMTLRAPPSIRKQLDAREHGAETFAAALKEALYRATRGIDDGDDRSKAALPFVKQVRTLSRYPHANSLSLALDLVLEVGDYSVSNLDTKYGCGCDDQPSDIATDDLFCYLARRMRCQDPTWDYKPVLVDLAESNKEYRKRAWTTTLPTP